MAAAEVMQLAQQQVVQQQQAVALLATAAGRHALFAVRLYCTVEARWLGRMTFS
jgi:hypothetical protein